MTILEKLALETMKKGIPVFDKEIPEKIVNEYKKLMEIVNYIYFKVKFKNNDNMSIQKVSKDKKSRVTKKGKVVDAIIEEDK